MQTHPSALFVNGVNQPLLPWPDEFLVDARTHQRSRRIADSNNIRSRFNLRTGKENRSLQRELEEIVNKLLVIGKISHQAADSAQVSRLRTRPFHPSFDKQISSHALAQQLDSLYAVFHAPPGHRAGGFHAGKQRLVNKQRLLLVDGGRTVLIPFDIRTQVTGFPRGIGDGGDIVEAKTLSCLDLRLRHNSVIASILPVFDAEHIGGKHHGDGHTGKAVSLLRGKHGKNSFAPRHSQHFLF